MENKEKTKIDLLRFVSIGDVEQRAMKVLPKAVRDYYRSGAEAEATLDRNVRAFKNLLIRPLILRDVSRLDPSMHIELRSRSPIPGARHHFSRTFSYPIGIAPTAFQRMAHSDGEVATVKAAGEMDSPMICSTLSTTSLEDIAAAAPDGAIRWFQLYIYKDRSLTEALVRRAEASGYSAIVLTVDAPTMGRRRADERNGFVLPSHLRMANFESVDERHSRTSEGATGSSGLAAYTLSLFDASLNWEHLRWLIQLTRLPVLVKGVVRGDDAVRAVESGVAALIVSNHGGRQLDHCVATIEALPEVVAAVNGRCPVFLDGGIRCGTDILKALALGAEFVFVGRPVVYGLAVGGVEGVKHVLSLLRTEFDYALRLSGCQDIRQLRSADDLVVHKSYFRASKI